VPGPMRNVGKPHSRATRAGGTRVLLLLPNECSLPVPPLPGGRKWSADERKLWKSLWTGPQANAWDDSFVPAVAAYIVHATAVYEGTASAWQAAEFRHLGAQLGLTPAGLLNLGWAIDQEGAS